MFNSFGAEKVCWYHSYKAKSQFDIHILSFLLLGGNLGSIMRSPSYQYKGIWKYLLYIGKDSCRF